MFGQDPGEMGKRTCCEWNFLKWEEAVKLPILSTGVFSFYCFAMLIAAPSGKLDIWREVTPVLGGRNVTLFWKVRHPYRNKNKALHKGIGNFSHDLCAPDSNSV